MATRTAGEPGPTSAPTTADRLLLRAASQGGRWLPVLIATSVVLAAAAILMPALIGRATDAVLGRAPTSWFVWLSVAVAVMVACDALEELAAGATTAHSTAWLRRLIFGHVMAVGTPAVERFGAGDIASRLTGNSADAGRVAQDAARAFANAVPSFGGIVALGLIDPWLCVTFLAGLPIMVALVRVFARASFDVADKYLAAQARIANRLVDALSGSRTIAASGTVDREADRVLSDLPELHNHGIRMWRTQIRMTAQEAVVVSLLETVVLAVAGVELAAGRITPGQLIAAGQYVLLAATLGHAPGSLGRMGRDRAASKRAVDVLQMEPTRYGARSLPPGRGRLDFRRVTVNTGGRTVINQVDLTIPPGALVAIVGESGSGKSLLGALAGRLLDPDEGEVLLDGVPLPSLEHRQLRRAVTYGFERPNLVGESVSEAIAFGAFKPEHRVIRAAAASARADGFIRRLPRGYRTPLPEAPMSGGEQQRVGLARAFAHAGRLMILDDVAASLDTVTEHQIAKALTDKLSDRSRLLVAHRASTAARADLVVWLESGRVRSVAPHHELWRDGEYRALFQDDSAPQLSSVGETSGTPA